jgi:prefoldin alpha subunit
VTQENLQEKLMLFQLMEKQLETLAQHQSMVDARIAEAETTKAAIAEVRKLGTGNEALVPLGTGLYAKATITGKTLLTELGANVMKENDFTAAGVFLDKRIKELEKAGKQIEDQVKDITEKLNEIGPELQKMAAQVQQ